MNKRFKMKNGSFNLSKNKRKIQEVKSHIMDWIKKELL